MKKKYAIFIIFLVFLPKTICLSQSKIISGYITDDVGVGLDNASVMARPQQKQAVLKFAIADENGRYRLQLDSNISYTLSVSYIGFFDENFEITSDSKINEHVFKLKKNNENIKEITIKYDVKPLIIKQDTLIYDIKSFTNGTERKLKDQLKKLPGVEVDKKGNVTVQGKSVTTFLVENKLFFGGGTKLGVENIPADAVEKVEVLDHFTNDGFMKKVSGSKQLAMNIKLKKDKKKFTFGDLESASGQPDFYKLHSGIFSYKPLTNISFIGDLNNIGKNTLEYEDIMRFDGGSDYLINKFANFDLFAFFTENTNVLLNKTQFSALNFSHQVNKKVEISGYGLLSKVAKESKNETQIKYIQNETTTFENKNELGNSITEIGILKLRIKYNPNENEVLKYDANLKYATNSNTSFLQSISVLSTDFITNQKSNNFSFNHFAEWNKSVNLNSKLTFVINQNLEKSELNKNWLSSTSFFEQLPLQIATNYNLNQIGIITNNSIDGLFKWYWILDNFNHLYFAGGNTFTNTLFQREENQFLTNGTINNFEINGFGNNLHYKFNDAFIGVEYKSMIKKWTNKLSLYAHNYQLITENFGVKNVFIKTYFEPEINSDYEFSKAHTISFFYKFNNQFPKSSKLADRKTLQNYNSIYKGNQLLQNEQFHNLSLYYKKNDLFRGLLINGNISLIKKTSSIRDELQINGINQITTSIFSKNPENNLSVNGTITKNVNKFNFEINGKFYWSDYLQTINSTTNLVSIKSQNIGATLKCLAIKWPLLTFKYNKTYNSFSSASISKFQTETFLIDYEVEISNEFTFITDYNFQKNSNAQGQVTHFQTATANLEFKPKRSPWSFDVSITNAFNTKVINNNSFSDYLISQQTTYILPRIIMLHISFKL